MNNTNNIEQAFKAVLEVFTDQAGSATEEVLRVMQCLVGSPESERWKTAGESLLKSAESASTEGEKNYFIVWGCAFLGHSVDLARNEQTRRDVN